MVLVHTWSVVTELDKSNHCLIFDYIKFKPTEPHGRDDGAHWKTYAIAMLPVSFLGIATFYLSGYGMARRILYAWSLKHRRLLHGPVQSDVVATVVDD